jgi:hypothetical protein
MMAYVTLVTIYKLSLQLYLIYYHLLSNCCLSDYLFVI